MGEIADILDQGSSRAWITPDDVYVQGQSEKIVFLYGSLLGSPNIFRYERCSGEKNKKSNYCVHDGLIAKYLTQAGKYDTEKEAFHKVRNEIGIPRDHLLDTCLFGRQNQYYLAFWNESPALYDKLLMPCLAEMKKAGFYDPSVELSTPFGTQDLSEVEEAGKATTKDLTQTEKDRVSMLKRMHLARGKEKEGIRKAFGLWTDKPAEPGLYGKMYQQRFDPEVAKWWTPECNLNFREYEEDSDARYPWEVRKQQMADVQKALNKLTYGKGLDVDDIAKMPVRELIKFLDDDSPRFAAMVKSVASGAAETETKEPEPDEYDDPPWKSLA